MTALIESRLIKRKERKEQNKKNCNDAKVVLLKVVGGWTIGHGGGKRKKQVGER